MARTPCEGAASAFVACIHFSMTPAGPPTWSCITSCTSARVSCRPLCTNGGQPSILPAGEQADANGDRATSVSRRVHAGGKQTRGRQCAEPVLRCSPYTACHAKCPHQSLTLRHAPPGNRTAAKPAKHVQILKEYHTKTNRRAPSSASSRKRRSAGRSSRRTRSHTAPTRWWAEGEMWRACARPTHGA